MKKDIEFIDLEGADVVKVVLVIEMTTTKENNLKFQARKSKLNPVEEKYLNMFIKEKLK